MKRSRGRSAVRLFAAVLCVLFVAAALFSEVYIFNHLHHEHDHDGPDGRCVTCVHLETAVSLLKQLSTAAIAAAVIFGGLFDLITLLKPAVFRRGFLSLVSLKVRLNN